MGEGKIIIEEYENEKLVRIAMIRKEKIINIENLESSGDFILSGLGNISRIEEHAKGYLKKKLGKSDYELSSLLNQPFYNSIFKSLSWYHESVLKKTMGFKTVIDLEGGTGLFCRASINILSGALEKEGDILIRVYFRKEGNEYKIEKEELIVLNQK